MRIGWLVVVVGALGSCGKDSPMVAPTPVEPAPRTQTVSGVVTATNGGMAVSGVTVSVGGVSGLSDAAGRYLLTLPLSTSVLGYRIDGPGVLMRSGMFSAGSRALDLEAFTGEGFDQDYWRAVAHDAFDHPANLSPIRRWTRAPSFYLQTVDDRGTLIAPEVLEQVASLFRVATPAFTGGRLSPAVIERGTDSRVGQAGWITVRWTHPSDYCGTADVGLEGGAIDYAYDVPGCACGSQKIRPRTVKHELGHALGFWHTGRAEDLLSGLPSGECDHPVTAREQQYGDWLYRRPVGNLDPDTDPSSAVLLSPRRVH